MAYIGRQQDGFGVRSRFIYTATGGQTTFTTDDSSNALSYSDGAYVDVYLNGVLLDPSDYTATSLTSIVLDSGASADDVLEVIVYDVFSVFSGTFTNGITASEATITNGISAGSATVTGDLTVDTDTLYVDSTNNRVGIGTSSPLNPLHISKSSGDLVTRYVSGDGDDVAFFMGGQSSSSSGRFLYDGSDNMRFYTNSSERMRIDSSGNVGVGTSLPDQKIHVSGAGTQSIRIENTNTNLIVGSVIGSVEFEGNDLGASGVTAAVKAVADSVTGKAALVFDTGTAGSSTEAMRIDSSGDVGIGTSSPATKLAVSGGYISQTDGTRTLYLGSDGTGGLFGTITNHYLRFITNNTERMRIDTSGNLLVGTTTFTGSGASSGKQVIQFAGATENGLYMDDTRTSSGTDNAIVFGRGSTYAGKISTTTAPATQYISASDQRLKENIADADDAGSKIDAIQVRKYDWIGDGTHQDYGLVAQELQPIAPLAVSGDPNSDEMMGIDYSKLVPMMIKEIQSLRQRITDLENA